jgi:hypothetical protein
MSFKKGKREEDRGGKREGAGKKIAESTQWLSRSDTSRPKKRPTQTHPPSPSSQSRPDGVIAQAVKRPIAVGRWVEHGGVGVREGVLSVLIGWGRGPSKIRAALNWRAMARWSPIAEMLHRTSLARDPACSVVPQSLLDAGRPHWRHVRD